MGKRNLRRLRQDPAPIDARDHVDMSSPSPSNYSGNGQAKHRSGPDSDIVPGDKAFGALAMYEVAHNTECIHHMLGGILVIAQNPTEVSRPDFSERALSSSKKYIEQGLGMDKLLNEEFTGEKIDAQRRDALKVLSLLEDKQFMRTHAAIFRTQLEGIIETNADSIDEFSWDKN